VTNPLKVKFQFSASDLAEVAFRSVDDSPVVKTWRLQGTVIAIGVIGLLLYAFIPGTLAERAEFSVIVCGLTAVLLYLSPRKRNRKNKLLKFYRDKLGGDGPFDCEVELTSEGLTTRQFGAEGKHAWTHIISAVEVDDGIEFKYRPMGVLIVRNRAFETAEARREFLRFARQQIEQTKI
jgi:hypothetical protein